MERNETLFRMVADAVALEPEHHDQNAWCGTSKCVAGWAIFLSGKYKFVYGQHGETVRVEDAVTGERVSLDYGNEGRALLGIDYDESEVLFSSAARPKGDVAWPSALREIAAGAEIDDVIGVGG